MPRTAYKHLFFDLDHTLWDFERNSAETLGELYDTFGLCGQGVATVADFQRTFSQTNHELWRLYDTGQISQTDLRYSRFRRVFAALGVEEPGCCDALNERYLAICPGKGYLIEGATELLEYLAPRYTLHVITNGFNDVQHTKLRTSGLAPYFREVITAQRAEASKPAPAIYTYALRAASCTGTDCVMIGDNWENDVLGAQRAGLAAIWYNPERSEVPDAGCHHVATLRELTELF
jgi:YjjG family noncanonical pyrimidine nucleotidase